MVRDHNYPRLISYKRLVSGYQIYLITKYEALNTNQERSLTYWKKVIEREDNSRDVLGLETGGYWIDFARNLSNY